MTYGETIVRGKKNANKKWRFCDMWGGYHCEKLDRYWLSKNELSPASKFSKQEVLQILIACDLLYLRRMTNACININSDVISNNGCNSSNILLHPSVSEVCW